MLLVLQLLLRTTSAQNPEPVGQVPDGCLNANEFIIGTDPALSDAETAALLNEISGGRRRLQAVSGSSNVVNLSGLNLPSPAAASMGMSAAEAEEAQNQQVEDYLLQEYPNKVTEVIANCQVSILANPDTLYECGDGNAWNLESTCCEPLCDGANSGSCAKDPEGQVYDPNDVSTIVFVPDTGCNGNHNMFQANGNSRIIRQFDCMSNTSCPETFNSNIDGHGHGSHCAGTVAGNNYGVNQKAAIICIKVLGDNGSGSMAGVLGGVQKVANLCKPGGDYADKNCVMSMSLGGGGCPSFPSAYDAAVRAGVSVVVAAGNSAENASGSNPACYGNKFIKGKDNSGYDEDVYLGGILTVGATNPAQEMNFGWWGSNYGDAVGIYAPGVNIPSADNDNNNGIVTMSGTSMACPLVAGVVSQCLMEEEEFDASKSYKDRINDCFERIMDCEPDFVINTPTGNNKPLLRRYQGPFSNGGDCKTCGLDGTPAPTPPPIPTNSPTQGPTPTPTTGQPTNSPTTPAPTDCDAPPASDNDDFGDNVRTCCEFEPYDDGSGFQATGRLESGPDDDWCELDVDPKREYVCTTTTPTNQGSNYDTILRLYGSDGAQIAENDDCGGDCPYSLHSRLTFSGYSGAHYLGVTAYGSSTSNTSGHWQIDCTASVATTPAPAPPCEGVYLRLLTDNYPRETSYKIVADGDVIHDKNFYDGSVGQMEWVEECHPVPDSSKEVQLQVFDTYGDGTCCNYGRGEIHYTYYNGPGKKLPDFTGRSITEDIPVKIPPTPSPTTPIPTTGTPTPDPTFSPTGAPSVAPTDFPTSVPTEAPTLAPWTCEKMEVTFKLSANSTMLAGTFFALKETYQNHTVYKSDKLTLPMGQDLEMSICLEHAHPPPGGCFKVGVYHRGIHTDCDVNYCGDLSGSSIAVSYGGNRTEIDLGGDMPVESEEEICFEYDGPPHDRPPHDSHEPPHDRPPHWDSSDEGPPGPPYPYP